jgi:hypothetical protein
MKRDTIDHKGSVSAKPVALLYRLALFLGLLLVVAACAEMPPVSSVGTPSPTVISSNPEGPPPATPTLIAQPIGPLPHCRSGTDLQQVFVALGPVAGQAPIWVAGFSSSPATLLIDPSSDKYTQYGWLWILYWEVGPRFTQQIALRGLNVQTKTLLWFQFQDEPATTAPILDPQHPNHPASNAGAGYAEWSSYIYIPAAGCYTLEATWPEGQWQIFFAAGHE